MSEESKTTLKPCPFCGHAANLYETAFRDPINYHAYCSDTGPCDAEGMEFEEASDAIYWWNRRAKK